MLRPGTPRMIDRLPAETPDEHRQFLAWLTADPRPPADPVLASSYRWTERANAYDAVCSSGKPEDMIRLVTKIEAQRLLQRVASGASGVSQLSPKELLSLVQFLRELPPEPAQKWDLANFSEKELREWQRLMKKARQGQDSPF